jgi:hypothetical protein
MPRKFLHRSIHVEQAWVQSHTGRPTLGPPKSEGGFRTLSVPTNVIPALEDDLTRSVGGDQEASLFTSAGSDGGCNELCELLRWCHESERLAWSSVEAPLDAA